MGGGGNDAVKNTNTNEIQILFAGYQKPAKLGKKLCYVHCTGLRKQGFQNIFLRRRFPVFLIDQPRRGKASRGTVASTINASPDEQLWFGIFRMGIGKDFYPGVQFSKEPEALNQFFRHMVPNTAPYDIEVNTNAVASLFDKIHKHGHHVNFVLLMTDLKD